MKPNRTWVYAPEPETLDARWAVLIGASQPEKPELLKETADTRMNSDKANVPGMAVHAGPIGAEVGSCPPVCRVAHRPFDRRRVIPDSRFHHRPSPSLWYTYSGKQICVVEQHAHPVTAGPALIFSALIPDMDFHSGRGGRVLPLYRDARASAVNVSPRPARASVAPAEVCGRCRRSSRLPDRRHCA
ncbi:type ISP restriction/modification enzyme [Amycolatopsis sp. NPDC003865]